MHPDFAARISPRFEAVLVEISSGSLTRHLSGWPETLTHNQIKMFLFLLYFLLFFLLLKLGTTFVFQRFGVAANVVAISICHNSLQLPYHDLRFWVIKH